MECWFCGKEKDEKSLTGNIEMNFKKYRYADKIRKGENLKPKGLREKLVIGRCDGCLAAHKTYNRISLFVIIPFIILAIACFLLFEKVNQNIVFILLALSTIGFGIVVYYRMKYLSKRGIKSLVELEIQNEDIQSYLADGWYRKI